MLRAPKGLEGVVVADTSITKIDGQAGRLVYRGYDVTELAKAVPFEAIVHLLWKGKLPNSTELESLKTKLAENRNLPNTVTSFLETAPRDANPLSILISATSILGLHASEKVQQQPVDVGIALVAQFPVIMAFYQRLRKGKELLQPRPQFGHAKNYLYILTGEEPSSQDERALNAYFILLADHGLNASTFVSRVATSTLTDVYSAVVAAIATLKGPLHGGAPSQAWEMFKEIGKPQKAEPWLRDVLGRSERIMGFGHRVYRTEDPRSRILKQLAHEISDPSIFELASTVENISRRLLREEHPERPLDTNVEFYSSLVLNAVGIPPDMFTPTFACSRVVGWTAHILEQLSDNRLIRPTANYVGTDGLKIGSKQ